MRQKGKKSIIIMESPWEILQTINNGYNFPTGHSIAWWLTYYFPVLIEMKQQHIKNENKCFLRMGRSNTLSSVWEPSRARNNSARLQSISGALISETIPEPCLQCVWLIVACRSGYVPRRINAIKDGVLSPLGSQIELCTWALLR